MPPISLRLPDPHRTTRAYVLEPEPCWCVIGAESPIRQRCSKTGSFFEANDTSHFPRLHASSPARAGRDHCSSASNPPRTSKIMEPAKASSRRCAIYTLNSSEEGLEQDFNSLQAQREACEAFIKSQAGEGWRLVKTPYDDGGLSGGTMERPALMRWVRVFNKR